MGVAHLQVYSFHFLCDRSISVQLLFSCATFLRRNSSHLEEQGTLCQMYLCQLYGRADTHLAYGQDFLRGGERLNLKEWWMYLRLLFMMRLYLPYKLSYFI